MQAMNRIIGTALTALTVITTAAAATPVKPAAHSTAPLSGAPATGTYRATFRGNDGGIIPAVIALENLGGRLSVLVVTDAPTALQVLSVSESQVEAKMSTSTGIATVKLEFSGDGMRGTIVEGKHVWVVDGRRSS